MGPGAESWVHTSGWQRAFSRALLWPSPLGALVLAGAQTDQKLVAGAAGEECSPGSWPWRLSQTKTRSILGAVPG